MRNKDFVRGVAILSKYVDPEEFGVRGAYDQIFFGGEDLPLTPEEHQELLDLGWSIEEESWQCPT